MKVWAKDRLTFFVESEHDGEHPYVVDMAAHGGRGECSCRDWQCRCGPMIKALPKVVLHGQPNRNTCKHVLGVTLFLGKSVVARLNGTTVEELYE